MRSDKVLQTMRDAAGVGHWHPIRSPRARYLIASSTLFDRIEHSTRSRQAPYLIPSSTLSDPVEHLISSRERAPRASRREGPWQPLPPSESPPHLEAIALSTPHRRR